MDIRLWLRQWLGIQDLHRKLVELEERFGQIEGTVSSILGTFGNYRLRTGEELTLMRTQLETMLATVSNVMDAVENQADIQRAARLRTRLKNNLTRVNNTLSRKIV